MHAPTVRPFLDSNRSLRHGGAARAVPPRSMAMARSAGTVRRSLRAVGVRLLLTAAILRLPLPSPADACPSSPTRAPNSSSSYGPRFGVDKVLPSEVKAVSVPCSVPVRVAYQLHQAGHRYHYEMVGGVAAGGEGEGSQLTTRGSYAKTQYPVFTIKLLKRIMIINLDQKFT
jgi:hypothetical protein